MILRVARPWQHPKSGIWYLRERIPSDVFEKARGTTIRFPPESGGSVATVRDRTEVIKASLRTKENKLARGRHAEALKYLRGHWDNLRQGPRPLTDKQIIALAGHIYRVFDKACHDDPGSADLWRKSQAHLDISAQCEKGVHSLMIADNQTRRLAALEKIVGGFTDATLAHHRVVADEYSRRRLLEAVADAMMRASKKLERNAEGDYRPDPDADRFPKWEPPSSPSSRTSTSTLSGLFEGWALEAKSLNKTDKTIREYRSKVQSFITFIGHDQSEKVEQADIVRFKAARIAAAISAKTVKVSDLATLKVPLQVGCDKRLPRQEPR